ncbi:uncharacterized protein LY89DRAFT_730069 [Mollisia scopiformis]|uniref:Uncharacterized protein n=1 Tax=Mollisia scopiformis TaxID=149040 RepID=A0A194XNF2_MOLSC|nr:uncharacterized protein LY89DRAFT_730069 [Mollisia scopiformis]KUJ21282.1 hypothetical protein LY89DRAFT_730069 [Mollisia scopiformis]
MIESQASGFAQDVRIIHQAASRRTFLIAALRGSQLVVEFVVLLLTGYRASAFQGDWYHTLSSESHMLHDRNLDTSQPSNRGRAQRTTKFDAWKALFSANVFKRFNTIGVWIMIFQQCTGINAVFYYAPQILYTFGFTSVTTDLLATGVTGVLQTYSPSQQSFPLTTTAAKHSSSQEQGVSIVASTNWMFNFLIGLTVKDMLASMKCGTYIFFVAFCGIGGVFVWIVVPETKNKTLEELDVFFRGDKEGIAVKDRESMRAVKAKVGLAGVENLEDLKGGDEKAAEHQEMIV